MNAPDTNLLVYAYNRNDPYHAAAKTYWQDALNGTEPIGIPVLCLHGFIRISTGSYLGDHRLSIPEAVTFVNEWLKRPHIRILYPGPKHWPILEALATQSGAAGQVFTDAAIAAIAIEFGAVVHTYDNHFARFPGLRWHNPLKP